jgi:hypothetical protein
MRYALLIVIACRHVLWAWEIAGLRLGPIDLKAAPPGQRSYQVTVTRNETDA